MEDAVRTCEDLLERVQDEAWDDALWEEAAQNAVELVGPTVAWRWSNWGGIEFYEIPKAA